VVRANPADIAATNLPVGERVSPSSVRVTTSSAALERDMARARLSGVTHHAYEIADSGREFLITDRVHVKFKAGTKPDAISRLANTYALVPTRVYSDTEVLYQLTDATGMNPVKLVVKLSESERHVVEKAEQDLNHRPLKTVALPTDERYLRQWHLHTRLQDPQFDVRASASRR
jgi:hypothetical protein